MKKAFNNTMIALSTVYCVSVSHDNIGTMKLKQLNEFQPWLIDVIITWVFPYCDMSKCLLCKKKKKDPITKNYQGLCHGGHFDMSQWVKMKWIMAKNTSESDNYSTDVWRQCYSSRRTFLFSSLSGFLLLGCWNEVVNVVQGDDKQEAACPP